MHFLLGQVFRALIVAGHLFERHRRAFCSEPSAGRQADRSDGAAIDRALDAGRAGCFEKVACAGHVDVVEDRRVLRPEGVVGRHVVELAAAGQGCAQRGRIAQVAGDLFNRQPLQILQVGPGPGEHADIGAGTDERTGHRPSDKSGRACD